MTHHRIGHLELRVRAAHPDPDLEDSAEQFARAVLERCGDRLEERAPGRRFLVRRLPLEWSCGEAALADTAEIEGLAKALAADLLDSVSAPGGLVPADGNAVAFDDDAHWRAAHLHACARGGSGAWYFAQLGDADEARTELVSPARRELAANVLARLARHGALLDVLAAAPVDVVEAWMDLPVATAGAPQGAGGTPELVDDLLEELVASRPRHLSPSALRLGLRVHARAFLGGSATAAALDAAVARAPAGSDAGTAAPMPPLPVPAGALATPGSAHTEYGGLFFLLNPLLELRIGEMLFAACLPEVDVLLLALAALLGDAGAHDPAPALCAGGTPHRPFPAITASQHEEIAPALLDELVRALPRRGLATLPAVTIALHGTGDTRLLIARTPDAPFVLFAWPAATPAAASIGLRLFLEHWPASAPAPLAAPPLAELDRTGRVRASRVATATAAALVPSAPRAPAAALLAQLAGAAAVLFAARAVEEGGEEEERSDRCNDRRNDALATFVARHLAAPAVAELIGRDELVVSLSAAAVGISLRRAGLDRDPGWVPWLGRHVRFRFTGLIEEW